MSWHTRRLAAFDIETTGVDPRSDRIVTAAVSLAGGERPTVSRAWLVDPGVEIPEGATAVHGITTADARAGGRSPAEAVEEVTAALAEQLLDGVPVIAFNARFDLTCLDAEARRHGVMPLVDRVGGPDGLIVVDPFVLDKQFDRYRPGKRTLGAVCEHYRVRLDAAHDANADAIAAARVAWRLAQRIAVLRDAELRALHARQVVWAARQAASLEEYFRELGNDEPVEQEWPIVGLAAVLAARAAQTDAIAVAAASAPALAAASEPAPALMSEPDPKLAPAPAPMSEPAPACAPAPEPERTPTPSPAPAPEPEPLTLFSLAA